MVDAQPGADNDAALPTAIVLLDASGLQTQLVRDIRVGLSAKPQKWIPSKWFYDDRGSDLFDQITKLPEYYPTRTEIALIEGNASRIAELSGAETLIELGPGSGAKAQLLVDELVRHSALRRYVPVDVSSEWLAPSFVNRLADLSIQILPIVADYERQASAIDKAEGQSLCLFLGTSYGNLFYDQRIALMKSVNGMLAPSSQLLLGIDLVKDPAVLVPAYDDSQGITASFNLNILSVINKSLGANFDATLFRHLAIWNDREKRIEMHLQALQTHNIEIPRAEMTVTVEEGETIRTEICVKFTHEQIQSELATAGLTLSNWWTDEKNWYALSLARKD